MTTNSFTQNINQVKSVEEIKQDLAIKFNKIFQSQISPENIFSFYDKSLNGLIDIVNVSVIEYIKIKGQVGPSPELKLRGKELEDIALNYFGIKSVGDALDAIQSRNFVIEEIQDKIVANTNTSKEIFVPPNDDEKYGVEQGSGTGFDEKKLMPRLVTLIYILQNDLGLYLGQEVKSENNDGYSSEKKERNELVEMEGESEIKITRGEVKDNMMRDEPYYKVEVFSKNRIVFICNEEGNASFVFDVSKLEEIKKEDLGNQELQNVNLEVLNKNTFNYLIRKYPRLGIRIIQSKDWRSDMLLAVDQDISGLTKEKVGRFDFANISNQNNLEVQDENKKPKQKKETKPKSDFSNLEDISKKQEGWESVNSLQYTVKAGPKKIKNFTETFRVSNPEYFQEMRAGQRATEHYSIELVQRIKEYFKNQTEKLTNTIEKQPGWESISSLKSVVRSGPKTIKKFTETFRVSNPEYFQEMKTGPKVTEHYSLELVQRIKEYFKNQTEKLTNTIEKQPGWESASSLESMVRSVSKNIKIFAETFRNSNPEYFKDMRTGTVIAEHYSPELVEKIKERFPLREDLK